jgi:hypothetical protein
MNAFTRLEAVCANVVERTFAVAFPSALQPVMIARKLVAAFESAAAGEPREGRRFLVQLAPADVARFAPDREYLERQWSTMLARLAERSGRSPRAPEVRLVATPTVAAGTVAIASETLAPPVSLAVRVRRGMPPNVRRSLNGPLTVGRDATCDLVLLDPRVSRRHVLLEASGAEARFRDLGSSNGTLLNGQKRDAGRLQCGDVLRVGDCELAVEDDDAGKEAT